MQYVMSIIGIIAVLGLCFALSNNKSKINFRAIAIMIGFQILIGWFMFATKIGQQIIILISKVFNKLIKLGTTGVDFLFNGIQRDFVFFLNVLLIIVFFSALLSIFSYLGVLPFIVRVVGGAISKITGLPRVESFHAVNSVFFGSSEALIVIKNDLQHFNKNRMFIICCSAMSSVSASVTASYVMMLDAKYVLAALPLNLFSSLIVCSLLTPVDTKKEDEVVQKFDRTLFGDSFIGAMINGALDGLKVAGIVAALMIAFIGVMEVVNYVISAASGAMGHAVTLQQIFGYVLSPFAFLMGIPTQDIIPAGGIMGTKIVLNEFVAILDLKDTATTLAPRTVGIVTVFLISFASISQIGAIVGTIRALSEKQGSVVSKFGWKMLFASTLASILSATIAGLFI
ncbi:pyrimidine nucleoside transporter NupC [Bacillus cereus]|uniref:NupC/NupG family nucleoside CNT transporter n=1 Tax=Bacillus cereus TaxID=1396 RepID=UPI0007B6A200|nr:nucleoside transporter C-terminal domain-containing protein [Bacillus cereus]MRC31041.1 NupC/NupG family nucleoside CNT transporter [Bacillus thuringiensis]ANC17552.1 pyrimidine nucleoside transporter NupC [Bacillus cereus]MDA2478832.1 NupC/NupG family nucleoside CNT transporter [Bacillus cereus]MDA2495892.1 NupC/NupG family nucleoside CNT transporter [Bacillus cereus]HDR8042896.1 NupC/NupG family nucleoside CNT transporter [Bacillus cereus]